MDLIRVARRVSEKAKSKKKKGDQNHPLRSSKNKKTAITEGLDVENPGVEYAFMLNMDLTATFEGGDGISKAKLFSKLKVEIEKAFKQSVSTAAKSFGLVVTGASVDSIAVNSAVNDQGTIGS